MQHREAIARDLRAVVRGDVRFDAMSRALYSTDASIHQIEPIGVVIPRDAEDVHAVVDYCARQHVAILPRGGGTSLAGQSVGEAVILDFSNHLHHVLEINAEERWARVQPGLVLDAFNRELLPHGLMFGPDVAPSNRATLGGMIGNNSCGTRSVVYGKTVDHVQALRVILADGSRVELGPERGPQALRDAVTGIARDHADEIRERFPRIMRRVSGYNLDALLGDRPNLAHLVVGSEGTLAVVEEARVGLVPRPRHTGLLLGRFRNMDEALQGNEVALTHAPTAVELLDRFLLDMARKSPEYRRHLWFLDGEPSEMLVVEFAGDEARAVESRMADLEGSWERHGLKVETRRAFDAPRQAAVWKIRKAGLPLLLAMPGDRKPVAFVEDTAVAPERLAEFVKRFQEVVDAHGTQAAFYAHASVGCLHIRPILDLKDRREVQAMRDIAEAIFALTMEFGGCMSGEHGDGLSRSMFNRRQFGDRLYEAFRATKRAFDPHGVMNPGKIVDAPEFTEHLRYGEGYPAREVATVLDWSREGGFARAVERCNGSAVCRKMDAQTMCPSYMATRDEEHSTRGRANALRGIISGLLPAEGLTDERMRQVMDLCVECKACKTECPAGVDMARLKLEFQAQYYKKHGVPLRSRLFAEAAGLGALGTLAAAQANAVLESRPVRWILDRVLGIDARRTLPKFATKRFTAQVADRLVRQEDLRHRTRQPQDAGRQVALFPDTFTEFHHPGIGLAAIEVLEAAGATVRVTQHACCGRPAISKGLVKQAWEQSRTLLEVLTLMIDAGCDVVGCEPSCVVAVRDDARGFLPDDMVSRVAARTFLLEEYLVKLHEAGELPAGMFCPLPGRALLHVHCQHKALSGVEATAAALRLIPELEVEVLDAGCCGMAGSFGYEKEHYDVSVAMGERRLLPAVRNRAPGTWVVATGTSCRQQIQDLATARALHPAQLLARALRGHNT